MKMRLTTIACLACCLTLVFFTTGCKSNRGGDEIDPNIGKTGSTSGGPERTTTGRSQPDIDVKELERMLFSKDRGLAPVYFDFDKYDLRADAKRTLKENAQKIRRAPGVMIQVEGHCDERGTQEYNLALSERRALAVREYLIGLGVSGNRIITIPYGEEKPVALGHNEAAWSKNRRSEFNRHR